MNIIDKFNQRADAVNSLLCVGLDSHYDKLPTIYHGRGDAQFAFNRMIIEQTHEFTAAYKPNMAFYEARGEAGLRDLADTIAFLKQHHPDIVTICDAKRADIGSTSDAYAEAIFDHLGFDAVTLHPYLGREALEPFLKRADKASIILCRTSNPGAGEFQDLLVDGHPLWLKVAQTISQTWNKHQNCMLVVGATYPDEMSQIRQAVGEMPFLVPGIGAQGGNVEATVGAGKTQSGKGLIINASRSIIFADDPAQEAKKLRDEINLYR